MKHTKWMVADEKSISLWHDPQCGETLLQKSAIDRAEITLPTNDIVEALITVNSWNQIVENMNDIPIKKDILGPKIHYLLEHVTGLFGYRILNGEFNIKSAYEVLRKKKPKVT